MATQLTQKEDSTALQMLFYVSLSLWWVCRRHNCRHLGWVSHRSPLTNLLTFWPSELLTF